MSIEGFATTPEPTKTKGEIARETDERISVIESELAVHEELRDELARLQAMRAALKAADEVEADE